MMLFISIIIKEKFLCVWQWVFILSLAIKKTKYLEYCSQLFFIIIIFFCFSNSEQELNSLRIGVIYFI